jgi:hypothetical protein
MNGQFFEMDETDNEGELLAFDHESEAGDYEAEFDANEFGDGTREEREIELAAELLSVSDEQELDQFLGRIMRGARGVLNTPAGQKLKGLLRRTARRALPIAAQAIGSYIGGDRGAAFGGQVGSAGAQLLGLETEGLSPEDRELNIARGIVRLAGDAAQKLGSAPGLASSSSDPMQAAQSALLAAARRHAPGLASRMTNGGTGTNKRRSNNPTSVSGGRWIRRGGKIVVLGI